MRGHDQQALHDTFFPNGRRDRRQRPSPTRSGAPALARTTAVKASACREGVQIPVIWADVRDALRRRLGDVKFDSWLAKLELVAEVNGEVLISAASEHERTRVESDFGHFIQQAWDQADRDGRRVRIEARERISNDVMALARPNETVADADEAFDAPRRRRSCRRSSRAKTTRRSKTSWLAIQTASPSALPAASPWAPASKPTSSPLSARTASANRTSCTASNTRCRPQKARAASST